MGFLSRLRLKRGSSFSKTPKLTFERRLDKISKTLLTPKFGPGLTKFKTETQIKFDPLYYMDSEYHEDDKNYDPVPDVLRIQFFHHVWGTGERPDENHRFPLTEQYDRAIDEIPGVYAHPKGDPAPWIKVSHNVQVEELKVHPALTAEQRAALTKYHEVVEKIGGARLKDLGNDELSKLNKARGAISKFDWNNVFDYHLKRAKPT